jgi:hypothetical protein
MVGDLLVKLFHQKVGSGNVTLLKYLQDSDQMPAGEPLETVTVVYALSLVSLFLLPF